MASHHLKRQRPRPSRWVHVMIGAATITLLRATPPAPDTLAQFELRLPGNNTVTYASRHGSTPMLAWEQSGSDIDHYEIWLDGKKVDVIPAGVYGHLPGEVVGNEEPFRPYGQLADEDICYYTPALSKLSPGRHRWHVEAVDPDGNKRRSGSQFEFTVEKPGVPRVFVSHLGFLPGGNHRVVADGTLGATSFDLLDSRGKVVSSGKLRKAGSALGNYSFGNLAVPEASGTYRIRAGSEFSMWFPVGLGAKLNHEDHLRKYRNAYRRKRCGDTTGNWAGKACHLDDARMENGKRHGITGGWHASSDVRKIMRILQPAMSGLIDLKRVVNPDWDDGQYGILDEIKWGNRYLHDMQLGNGAIVQHYYLWCGATDWSEAINHYTNNVIGDADDRLLPEDTLVIDMLSQSRFIQNQTTIYRLFRDSDPAYARKCLAAATRCHDFFEKTWPVVTDYETDFNARPYQEEVTDLMPLAYGIRANLFMHLATDDPEYEDKAVSLADRLMALQEVGFIGNQQEVKGFFYADDTRKTISCSTMGHGGLDGAPGAVLVLADLCEALPSHPESPRWQECLRSYMEDYLLPLSEKNAFGLVPGFLSRQPLVGGLQVGDLHYQYLDDNRGVNKLLLRKAILLARGARILGKPEFREAAWRQLDWILGSNPFNASTVYGVGHGQPKVYKEHLAPRSDGMVIQGIGGTAEGLPVIRQGHWRHCEMELHFTAWFAQALSEARRENAAD